LRQYGWHPSPSWVSESQTVPQTEDISLLSSASTGSFRISCSYVEPNIMEKKWGALEKPRWSPVTLVA
jgi:hypothetical protein